MSREKMVINIEDEVAPRIEKYPDLSEDEFIPIEYIHKKYGALNTNPNYYYLINKKGEIISKKNNKYITGSSKNKRGYFIVHLRIDKNISIGVLLQQLVANTFLINSDPNKYKYVNHIDHNRENNKLSNLEFITISGNNNVEFGKKSAISEEKLTIYVGSDDKGNEAVRLNIRDTKGYSITSISKSIKENRKYKDLSWKRENTLQNRDNFYDIIGYSRNIDDYDWLKHPLYDNLFVCKEGFIKRNCRLGSSNKYVDKVIGTIKDDGYIVICFDGKTIFAHTIILEFILNRYLKEGEMVDHINTIRTDNSFSNLRLSNSSDNMNNNKLTIEKKRSKVVVTNLFGDILLKDVYWKDAYRFMFNEKEPPSCYNSSALLTSYSKIIQNTYICYNSKRQNDLLERLDKVYYIISPENEIYYSLDKKAICKKLRIGRDKLNNSLKNNKPINGYRILKGMEAKDILLANGHLTALKEFQDNIQTEEKEDK